MATLLKLAFLRLRNFGHSESGLVTVEWVALAGAVLIGGIAVVWIVLKSLQPGASTIGSNLASCEAIAASTSGNTATCP